LSGTALLRLHHVGYAVKTIEPMAEAYVQRYGYELSTGIIHDQLQTAFVQFLKLAEDSAYLEFVAPDGHSRPRPEKAEDSTTFATQPAPSKKRSPRWEKAECG
jgi:hypothetical protein